MKLKPILPSLKEKKRYISFEIISDKNISADEAYKAVSESSLKFLGTLDAGKAGMMFLKDKYRSNTGIIKTGHRYVDKLRSSLILIKDIEKNNVIFRTKIVSGTIKKAILKTKMIESEV